MKSNKDLFVPNRWKSVAEARRSDSATKTWRHELVLFGEHRPSVKEEKRENSATISSGSSDRSCRVYFYLLSTSQIQNRDLGDMYLYYSDAHRVFRRSQSYQNRSCSADDVLLRTYFKYTQRAQRNFYIVGVKAPPQPVSIHLFLFAAFEELNPDRKLERIW